MKMSATPLFLILTIPALSLWSGCETTERVLATAKRVVTGRTSKTIIDIATSKDAEQALRRHVEGYARDPQALLKDLRAAQRDFETLMATLRGEAGRTWGKKEVHLQPRVRHHPHGEQLQPLCRQFRAGLWTHAARARERRPRSLPARERQGRHSL